MKIPIQWLREYVEVDATAEAIAERLTFSGTEVEGISQIGFDYEGIVVAEILEVLPHPNADALSLCRVDAGGDPLTVVCGAQNMRAGDKAALATVGAKLADGTVLKRAKIRGQESLGMLCAEDELGLSEDHAGILLLPQDAVVGSPLIEVLGPPETVLELEVTWNRSDCLSVLGMAREVAALYGTELKRPDVTLKESGEPVETRINVEIEDGEGCPRYTVRVMSDITVGPSPMWMQQRLRACGVRPISNIVDVTNYVLLECGHPLHAFDYERVNGQRIVVRRAGAGEVITTLDGVAHTLDTERLIIADGERPVAVAGVMGGEGSEICETTTSVLLESACFDPGSVHRTSVALGVSSESSHRFERGVDVGGVEWASRRAASLMASLTGATVASGVVDRYPGEADPVRIVCGFDAVRSLLGIDVASAEVIRILEALELAVVDRNDESCTVVVPSFRRDLSIEADLIEEIARMHGLEQLPEIVPAARIVPDVDDARVRAVEACRSVLVGLGLNETLNYSFLSEAQLGRVGGDAGRRVALVNPVSADHGVLRDSLVAQMLDSLGRNLFHQTRDAALFEIGRVFSGVSGETPDEHERLCVGVMGRWGREGMDGRRVVNEQEVFLRLKGIVASLSHARGGGPLGVVSVACPWAADGCAVQVHVGGKPVGVMGLVSDRLRREWRMQEPVAIAEVALDVWVGQRPSHEVLELPQYPSVQRDVAVVVDEGIRHENVVKCIEENASSTLTDVALFDIFRGSGIRQGCKSLAYALTYRSSEKTLTDEEVNKDHAVVQEALKRELNAELRDN